MGVLQNYHFFQKFHIDKEKKMAKLSLKNSLNKLDIVFYICIKIETFRKILILKKL